MTDQWTKIHLPSGRVDDVYVPLAEVEARIREASRGELEAAVDYLVRKADACDAMASMEGVFDRESAKRISDRGTIYSIAASELRRGDHRNAKKLARLDKTGAIHD